MEMAALKNRKNRRRKGVKFAAAASSSPEVPKVDYGDQAIPVPLEQEQVPMVQTLLKHVEIPQVEKTVVPIHVEVPQVDYDNQAVHVPPGEHMRVAKVQTSIGVASFVGAPLDFVNEVCGSHGISPAAVHHAWAVAAQRLAARKG